MSWNRTLFNLRDVLASLYPMVPESRQVVVKAGLNPLRIAFDAKAINNWFNILEETQKHHKVQAIVEVAHGEYPENEWLALAQQGNLPAIKGPDIKEDVTWRGPDDADQLEKIIGAQSTLLPISFLEVGLLKARSVARVVRADGASGSGFLTSDNLLVTNHHVLPTEADAQGAVVQFNYQETVARLNAPVEEFRLAPQDVFVTSPMEEDDWTAVHVQGNPNEKWGALKLARANPKVQDRVNIIQHPGGGPKQIALYHNVVVFVGNNRLQYLTDTLPGSSGSPVFDSDWRVVALHHSGGWLREPGSKRTYFRNEGIYINAIIEGLAAEDLYTA
jgi:V8-like Glu-specific endopeptidase